MNVKPDNNNATITWAEMIQIQPNKGPSKTQNDNDEGDYLLIISFIPHDSFWAGTAVFLHNYETIP